MTIKECIDIVDNLKPNQYSPKEKVMWLSFIDEIIINDVLKTHEGYDGKYDDFAGYSEDKLSVQLIVASPYDRLYTAYLKMKIDGENGETARYNNSASLFNSYLMEFRKHYNKTHMPLDMTNNKPMPKQCNSASISDAMFESLKRELYYLLSEDFAEMTSRDKLYDIVTSYAINNAQMLKGKDGRDGIDGKDGKDGRDGVDGKDGKDGVDATSSMITTDGTIVSPNADFAEVAEWADGNPDNEDRTGYFVCANVPVEGIVMKKATSIDDVKGVSILAPAFAGNYSKDKVDSNGNLLPKYSYVAIIGFVPVRDNGTCTVGGRCMPDDNGCAIPSSNSMGYQVINRIDENRVLIIIEPNGDMVQRVKTKINLLQEQLDGTVKKHKTESAGSTDALKNVAILGNEAFSGINSDGVMQYKPASNYILTDFIPIAKGKTLTFNGIYRMFCAFTSASKETPIADTYVSVEQSDFTYTATDDQFVQVVILNSNFSGCSIMTEGSEQIEIESGVNLNNEQIAQVKKELIGECEYKNMLTGKKWVVCGDSLTEGSSALTTRFESGLYSGQKKTYPFFVGRRCGMDVVNLAKSGSTLSVCGNSEDVLSVQMFDDNEKYLKEFEDADYITIKIGTNDDSLHQNKPDKNPPDNWVEIFSQAWDTVLSYLTSQYPKKHLGIVVSNVATLEIVEATITAATKWGVPYLNMALDPQLPLAYRSIRTDVQPSVKQARDAAFKVDVVNDYHPNAEWHEFESRMIESWLMTI